MGQDRRFPNDIYVSALAHLYDTLVDLPAWFRRLTPGQHQDIAKLMARWHDAPPRKDQTNGTQINDPDKIPRMRDVERDVVLHAVRLCEGNVLEAAAALGIGKTTVYRKLREWRLEPAVLSQASALASVGSGLARTSRDDTNIGPNSSGGHHRAAAGH